MNSETKPIGYVVSVSAPNKTGKFFTFHKLESAETFFKLTVSRFPEMIICLEEVDFSGSQVFLKEYDPKESGFILHPNFI